MSNERGPPSLFPDFTDAGGTPEPPASTSTDEESQAGVAGASSPLTGAPRREPLLPASLPSAASGDVSEHRASPSPSLDFRREGSSGMARNKSPPSSDIVKLIREVAHRHGVWQVFSDFCEMAASALSNAVDRPQFEAREKRYLDVVRRYRPDEVQKFPQMLAALTNSLEDEMTDVLGGVYHELELHNKWAGQFFTPYPVCQMMARMTLGDEADIRARIEARGFITAQEPAVGSGAMVIALAEALRDMSINYQRHLHVTAIDVDAKCVHMAYAQFALLHIPAVILHGNTLSLEEWGRWHTPAHILDGWRWKLRCAAAIETGGQVLYEIPRQTARRSESDEPGAGLSQLTLF